MGAETPGGAPCPSSGATSCSSSSADSAKGRHRRSWRFADFALGRWFVRRLQSKTRLGCRWPDAPRGWVLSKKLALVAGWCAHNAVCFRILEVGEGSRNGKEMMEMLK